MTGQIVFIVSEDALLRQSIRALVESAGLQVATFPTMRALLDAEAPESFGCLVFYPRNNILDDQTEQARLAAFCAGRPGILIIDSGDVPVAVLGLKAGITDVVQKPYRDKDLLGHIVKVLEANATV